MAGVLFVVCIPTTAHEKQLRKPDKNVSFCFDNVKAGSLDDVLVPRAARTNGNAGNAEELSALLSVKTELRFIDEGSKAASTASLGRPDNNDFDKTPTLLDLPEQEDNSMEQVLEELLKKLKIDNAVWCRGKLDNFYQVFFSVACGVVCEEALTHLHEWGIGINLNSIVSVLPCSLYYDGMEHAASEDDVSEDRAKKESANVSAWDRFVASVGARLTVAQVVERIKQDACLTFDFLVLLLIAGVVAAMGLIENSPVILVASMLISPLMGPIMAGTFGFVIEDKRLRRMGVSNEMLGLFICVVVGFAIGLAVGPMEATWKLPTQEMMSRGLVRSLWVGAVIALPSGAAVAIALLGDKTGSLVGVAISASILPPAVNAGLLWALACVRSVPVNTSAANVTQEVTFVYSEDLSVELAVMGAVSLCLTLVNILCIFLMGIIVLKIKEVAPRTSGKQSRFWRHDIKIARDYNKTVNKEDGKLLQKQLKDELAGFTDADLSAHHLSPETYLNLSHRLHSSRNQQTWSPSVRNTENRLSLQELEDLYMNLTGSKRTHSPVRRSSSWLGQPDATTPNWFRSHMSPANPSNLLSAIRETSQSFDAGLPKRRMTYSAQDVPSRHSHANKKRFVVSPVEENTYPSMS